MLSAEDESNKLIKQAPLIVSSIAVIPEICISKSTPRGNAKYLLNS